MSDFDDEAAKLRRLHAHEALEAVALQHVLKAKAIESLCLPVNRQQRRAAARASRKDA